MIYDIKFSHIYREQNHVAIVSQSILSNFFEGFPVFERPSIAAQGILQKYLFGIHLCCMVHYEAQGCGIYSGR